MTRDEWQVWLLDLFREEFEIEDPGLDDDLREEHAFDSIDAIELLDRLGDVLDEPLTQDEKKGAMGVRTLNDILDYLETLAAARG